MFKTCTTFLLSLLVGLINPIIVSAETADYRLPNEISEEEWEQVGNKKAEYNTCLKEEMINYVDKGKDARQVANQVLEVCSVHLHAIQKQMNDNNVQPEFTQRFIYNTKNKASRQMLGGIMMLMAQQQANKKEATSSTEDSQKE